MTSEWEVFAVAEELELWTIYDHPVDHPRHFVARRFLGDKPQARVVVSPDLETLRDWLSAEGKYVIPRSPDDDPTIVETWI